MQVHFHSRDSASSNRIDAAGAATLRVYFAPGPWISRELSLSRMSSGSVSGLLEEEGWWSLMRYFERAFAY